MVPLGVMRVPRSEVQINGIRINDENIEVTRNDKILMKLIQKFAFRIYFFQKTSQQNSFLFKSKRVNYSRPGIKIVFLINTVEWHVRNDTSQLPPLGPK